MSYINEAYHRVCTEAQQATGAYVCLMERATYYGGPEEGGWWGTDNILVEYQHFDTSEMAEAVKAKVEEIARQLSAESKRNFGEQCLREMEWLDARGLDADYLPEPDGPSEYYVLVSGTLPESSYGSRHYE